MPVQHECWIDCKPVLDAHGNIRGHGMYAPPPNPVAGRYQWEINQKIFRMGLGARKAWLATGQDETRECRKWNQRRVWEPRGKRATARLVRDLRPFELRALLDSSELGYKRTGAYDYLKDYPQD